MPDATPDAAPQATRRDGDAVEEETPHERLNRELDQLLSELRVALPGVQVLLAFLLTVPFAQGFGDVQGESRTLFVVAIALAALASVLLIAPTVHHRMRFREGTKEQMIRTANHLTLAGVTSMAVAIGCAVYVVGDAAFPDTPARWLGPAVVLVAGLTWFALPLLYREDETPKGR